MTDRTTVISEALAEHFSASTKPSSFSDDELTSKFMEKQAAKGWHRFAHVKQEIQALNMLEKTMKIGITPHGFRMAKAVIERGSPADISRMMNNWREDIAGGGAVMRCILALMNTKNILAHEPDDISRLNKARSKRGKPPLLPFTITGLSLSRARANAASAAGMSREQARYHLVRGHFKVRKTGVFWWSPFPRGDISRPVERRAYEVR